MVKNLSGADMTPADTAAEELPAADYAGAVGRLSDSDFVKRLWQKDAALWKREPAHTAIINNSLGWLDVPYRMPGRVAEIEQFAAQICREDFSGVALLGMGGSSLAPEVIRTVFQDPEKPKLYVMDTTDPGWILNVREKLDLKKTLFIFASKSGGTIEPSSQFRYFWQVLKKAGVKNPGANFAAITDPGTGLEKLAVEKKFRRIFLNFPDIGGRFSALSYFGLVPAALCGADIGKLLERAGAMADKCKEPDIMKNPGALLGALISALAAAGRDKLTLLMPKKLESFSLWIEQLVAESTGKEGKGVVPVGLEELSEPDKYQADRFFARTLMACAPEPGIEERTASLKKAGHPVYTIAINDPYDLGGEFFRWEAATAAAGSLMGIDPFDQPNVKEAKDLTLKALATFESKGKIPAGTPDFSTGRMSVFASKTLKAPENPVRKYDDIFWCVFLGLKEKEYIALLAYLPNAPEVEAELKTLRENLKIYTSSATTLSYGPRYLHSSGQLHKGGPDNAFYIILTNQAKKDIVIAGEKYTFSQLELAQAIGDFEALDSKNRRVLRIHLKHPLDKSLRYLSERISKLGRPREEVKGTHPQGEESKMLKLTTKKTNAKAAAKTDLMAMGEHVIIDHPKNLENITSWHYGIRIGATKANGVDISIDDQPWQPCRHSVGYWWYDWCDFAPGMHQLVARLNKDNGEYLLSKRRRCKVI